MSDDATLKGLIDALAAHDADGVAAWFEGSTPDARNAAAKSVRRVIDELRLLTWEPIDPAWGGGTNLNVRTRGHQVALMALLGLTRPSELTYASRNEFTTGPDTVLLGRALGADWCTALVRRLGQLEYPHGSFWMIRALAREGLAAEPQDEGYALAMISQLATYRSGLLDSLRADPGLLEHHVWRLFEIEGNSECSLTQHDSPGRLERDRWGPAFIALAESGEFDRDRLLDATLGALDQGRAPHRAGWFVRFHKALAPSPVELVSRRNRYLRLAGSRAPTVVGLALQTWKVLQKRGALHADDLLAHALPALRARGKGVVKSALRILGAAARLEPARASELARLAAEALAHEKADVQEAAIALLEEHAANDDGKLADVVRRHADLVAPSLRKRLAPWAGRALDDGALADGALADTALDAFAATPTFTPRIADRLEPIDTLEDLVHAFAAAVAQPEDADRVELVIDGVARLGAGAREQHPALLGPLAKRVRHLSKPRAPTEDSNHSIQLELERLAHAWTTGRSFDDERTMHRRMPPAIRFVLARMRGLGARAATGESITLLATPTHRGGCIEPTALVSRVAALPDADEVAERDMHDRVLAILRLAPEGRGEALELAADLGDGKLARALRHALGGAAPPVGSSGPLDRAAAAVRGNRPALAFHVDPFVLWANGKPGPGRMRVRATPPIEQRPADTDLVSLMIAPPDKSYDAQLEAKWVAWHDEQETRAPHPWSLDLPLVRWLATACPSRMDTFFALGASRIGSNLDWSAAHWEHRAFLEPLLEGWVRFEGPALSLLVLGLAAREPGEHGLAIDAALRAMESGRLGAEALGDEMARWLPCGLIKAKRWATTLGQIAPTSPSHTAHLRVAIQRALRGDPAQAPRDLSALLELLWDLCASTGRTLDDPQARDYLQRVTAGGKTRKAVRALLKD